MSRLVCWFLGHKGQKEGGTVIFTCPRCGGVFFQRHDFSAVTKRADALISEGQSEEALRLAREEIQRHA